MQRYTLDLQLKDADPSLTVDERGALVALAAFFPEFQIAIPKGDKWIYITVKDLHVIGREVRRARKTSPTQ
jgi:hypothetical protein